jgi:hypothetical protein
MSVGFWSLGHRYSLVLSLISFLFERKLFCVTLGFCVSVGAQSEARANVFL